MRAIILALAGFAGIALWPEEAQARVDEKGRPFGKGTLQPSLGAGASFGGSLSVVSIGLGARYFVANGLGPGLTVSDTILIYGDSLRADYPGIATQTPTNIVRLLPNLQWIFVRTRWFSPYVIGGVGPVFYNHGGGTVGEWMAGGGAYIGLGGPVFVDLGVGFTGVFPQQKCEDAFYYRGPNVEGQVLDACSFTWGPRLGLTIAFGVGGDEGGRSKRRRRRDREETPPPRDPEPDRAWEPPPEPAPPPPPEPAPAPAPEDGPPSDVADENVEGSPGDAAADADTDTATSPEGPEAPPDPEPDSEPDPEADPPDPPDDDGDATGDGRP